MTRAAIRPSDRFRIFQRDGFCCRYCGKAPDETELQIDHLIPHSKGGDNSYLNLITSCRLCNAGKGQNAAERVPIPIHAIETMKQFAERSEALAFETERYADAEEADINAIFKLMTSVVGCSEIDVQNTDLDCVRKLRNEFGLERVTEWMHAFTRKTLSMRHFCRWMHGCAKCERGE